MASNPNHPVGISLHRHTCSRSTGFRAYMALVMFCLPIDWFEPTGLLFREFGAKPATLLLFLGGLYALVALRPATREHARREKKVQLFFATLLFLGTLAFLMIMILDRPTASYARSPTSQFLAQAAMITVAGVATLGNYRLFSHHDVQGRALQLLPKVALIHLGVWMLETLFPAPMSIALAPFKSEGISLDRASGLHTEPSYYGTMAALFGIPLIALYRRSAQKIFSFILAGLLLGSGIVIVSKTLIIVGGAQLLYLALCSKRVNWPAFLIAAALALASYYFVSERAALDLGENMSTAMRLGSTHLALNVALKGYAATGIGIGQFHFFFTEAFAPEYLLYAEEALNQMSPDATGRASTYNFYVRVLLETGAVGLIIVIWSIIAIFRRANGEKALLGKLMTMGSLGFLLTQDTYFYPPLLFGISILLSQSMPKMPLKNASRYRKRVHIDERPQT